MDGMTLYEQDSLDLYKNFLQFFASNIGETSPIDKEHIQNFYVKKTRERLNKFAEKYSDNYLTTPLNINKKEYPSFNELFANIDFDKFSNEHGYANFHGDLQFDNIIFSNNKFLYIDWRESFDGVTTSGDLYYDLAKLYGGLIIPYNKMKGINFLRFTEEKYNWIIYYYHTPSALSDFMHTYESWLSSTGKDVKQIKLITALIFANMSPMHEESFAKMLICKSIELLNEYFSED
jgi:thiamine kinase-like enzyme